MPIYVYAAADFATSLVVLTTLAWWYGALRRWPFNGRAGALLMGAAFGLVAVLQMQMPIEPADGMIVDLRAVPIALAGAYLGSTGLLACLVLAVAARLAIGGVGMEAGVASILIAGLCGLGWSVLTARLPRRDWRHFLALGALTSLSLPSGMLLPGTLETWFFMSAAPVLALAYLSVIPLVAHLLERARISLVADRERGMNLEVDLPSGLATKNAFARHVAATNSSSPLPSVSCVLVMRIRHRGMLEIYWGRKVVDQIFSALGVRLRPLLRFNTALGRSCHGEVLVGLTDEEAADATGLQKKMARTVSDTAVTLPGGKSLRVWVDVRMVALSDPASQDAILGDLAPAPIVPRPFRIGAVRLARGAGGSEPWGAPDHDRLFSRLDRQMVSDD